MKQPKIFVHIGLPKTGTTFLQEKVFPKMDINFICKENLAIAKLSSKKVNLISDEDLSHKLDTFGVNRYEIAYRIHKLFPNAKIIIVFREKEKWLKSIYNQYLKSVYRPYMPFDKFKETMIENGALKFENYEQFLRRLFPNVLTLQFEDMKKDVYGFVSKICDFMGVEVPEFDAKPVNTSLTEKQLKLIQFVKARNISLWWKKKIVELLIFIFSHGTSRVNKKIIEYEG